MPDEAEIQDETPTPTHPLAMRIEEISEQDAEKLFEAARNPPETVLRIRREAKRMEVRERNKESKS